jgi:hypothetical protein
MKKLKFQRLKKRLENKNQKKFIEKVLIFKSKATKTKKYNLFFVDFTEIFAKIFTRKFKI